MRYLIFLPLILIFASCEREFTPDISTEAPDLVVEGYIEAGENPSPPYVILTKSQPFFNTIDSTGFDDIYVHNATVTVTHSGQVDTLTEFCLDNLPPELKEVVYEFLGLDPETVTANICAYLDPFGNLVGEVGETYHLKIESEGNTHTASTTIPRMVPIDSFYFKQLNDERLEGYRQMRAFVTDPADAPDYWRHFMQINDSNMVPATFSIFDDDFISGQTIEFNIDNAQQVNDDIDPLYIGLFEAGDTLTLKWTTIDEAHYEFWKTAEYSQFQGPFTSYIRITGNVENALGIWGGYNVSYLTTVIE